MVLKGPGVLFCSSPDGKTLSTINQFMNKSDFLTKPFFVLKIYYPSAHSKGKILQGQLFHGLSILSSKERTRAVGVKSQTLGGCGGSQRTECFVFVLCRTERHFERSTNS